MSTTHWRVIYSSAAQGAWNMALDEAILESTANRLSEPTLRLYAWEPACLSLGYAQPFSDVDTQALDLYRWHLVRRPTGGRAILHVDELTYSVCGPQDDPLFAGGVLESYHRLSRALLAALDYLGVKADSYEIDQPPQKAAHQEPVCFDVPSNYEITAQGKKLIGSAQARKAKGVLQHGSLPLHGDLTRITQALKYPGIPEREAAAAHLLSRATTIASLLGKAPTWQEAASAFQGGFQTVFDIEMDPSEPTQAELERAEVLVQEKYATPMWNQRI